MQLIRRSIQWGIVPFALICLLTPVLALGADKPVAATSGVRAELIAHMQTLENKFVGLAEAIPQAKYDWRPAPGVRSVSEVFGHVAGSNYMFAKMLGATPPVAVKGENLEKAITTQKEAVDALKQSFALTMDTIRKMSDADLEKSVKLFGQEMSARAVLIGDMGHQSEHLGQMIAYARMNGVVPPWSK
ncbi:MAG: DinB family protein [Thermoanaerobaculia bacterium]